MNRRECPQRFHFQLISLWVFSVSIISTLAACSTGRLTPMPHQTDRRGLFDRMAELDRARGRSVSGDLHVQSAVELKGVGLHWPLREVHVTSPFGKRGRQFHEGVDLKAKVGTPVFAAQAGRVLYAGKRIQGYGKLIVLRHSNGVATVYAHNSKLLVKKGRFVHRGDLIALSGSTGHVRGPHLHFEVRSGVAAMDPKLLLPSLKSARSHPERETHSMKIASRARNR